MAVYGFMRIHTSKITRFSTLEGLIDNILGSDTLLHIIICHGSPENGLILPFAKDYTPTATGQPIAKLAEMMRKLVHSALPVSEQVKLIQADLDNMWNAMSMREKIARRVTEKLIKLREKPPIIFFQACNIGANRPLLLAYKQAFSALAMTAPAHRQFFVEVFPNKKDHKSLEKVSREKPKKPKTRRRVFAPINSSLLGYNLDIEYPAWAFNRAPTNPILEPLILDVTDIDGHTRISTDSYMEHVKPEVLLEWAKELNGAYNTGGKRRFIVPLIWDNNDTTYYCAKDMGYAERLTTV